MTKENCFAFVYGQKGAGKTHLVRHLVSRAPRLLVADVTGDYDELRDVRTMSTAAAAARAFRRAGRGPCRVRLTASLSGLGLAAYRGQSGADAQQLGLRAAAVAWAAGDVALVLDELALFTTASATPPILRTIAAYGRHRRVSLLGTTRRPAEVSRLLTGLADVNIFFRLTEPPDLDHARRILGRAAERLPALPLRRAIACGLTDKLTLLHAPTLDPRHVETLSLHS